MNLYSFFVDCGRSGDLEGLFLATEEELQSIIGTKIWFGEVLGKHSEVQLVMKESYFSIVSDDADKIEWLESVLGNTISGFNPFDFINEDDTFEEDEE